MRVLGKILATIGFLFGVLIICGALYFILKTIFHSPKYSFIILLGCPFMAYAARKGTKVIVYAVLLLTAFCNVCVFASNGKNEAYIKSLFLNGTRGYHIIEVEGYTTSDDDYVPAHPERQYYFEVSPSEPIFLVKIIENGALLLPIGIMAIVYFMLKDDMY